MQRHVRGVIGMKVAGAPRLGETSRATRTLTHFVDVGPCFVNLTMSATRVWRVLWRQQLEFLGSEGKRTSRAPGGVETRLPAGFVRFARSGLAVARYVWRRNTATGRRLAAPVTGEIAILRRSGAIKVLELETGRVTTVMTAEDGFAEKLERRVRLSRRVERHPFAPKVHEVALDQGWFSEDFFGGTHPRAFAGCRDDFESVYLPLLVEFACAEPLEPVSLRTYIDMLLRDIHAPNGLLAKLAAEQRADVTRFVGALERKLALGEQLVDTLPRTLSHGDYFSGNVVVADDGSTRAIDWAHLGKRSPLYDLYYVVMNHCLRILEPAARQVHLVRAIESFRRELRQRDPERFESLDPALIDRPDLRWLFYLECVHVPLTVCDDPDDRYVRAMLQRIRWFRAYEDDVGVAIDDGPRE